MKNYTPDMLHTTNTIRNAPSIDAAIYLIKVIDAMESDGIVTLRTLAAVTKEASATANAIIDGMEATS